MYETQNICLKVNLARFLKFLISKLIYTTNTQLLLHSLFKLRGTLIIELLANLS